jgi:hypothetical protein
MQNSKKVLSAGFKEMPMTPFGNIVYKKQGQSLFIVLYHWKNGTKMQAKVFTRTEAGAIARTYPLALACGLGVDPDTHAVVKNEGIDRLEGHTVETNVLQRLKSNRTLKADEKRECLDNIQRELVCGMEISKQEWIKVGRIIR